MVYIFFEEQVTEGNEPGFFLFFLIIAFLFVRYFQLRFRYLIRCGEGGGIDTTVRGRLIITSAES